MILRTAQGTDIEYMADSLIKLCCFIKKNSNDPYSEKLPSKTDNFIKEYAMSYIESDECFKIIIEENGNKIACSYGRIQESQLPVYMKENVGFISVLWVEPAYRTQDVHQILYQSIERYFSKKGIKLLELSYMAANASKECFQEINEFNFVPCFAYRPLKQ